MSAFVLEQRECGFETLAQELLAAFRALVTALGEGRPAIVVVREREIAGHGEPAAAALAHGLLGLVRALALEGARDGWVINAVAIGEGTLPGSWLERLADPDGLRGALVRLGDGHLGRIAV